MVANGVFAAAVATIAITVAQKKCAMQMRITRTQTSSLFARNAIVNAARTHKRHFFRVF